MSVFKPWGYTVGELFEIIAKALNLLGLPFLSYACITLSTDASTRNMEQYEVLFLIFGIILGITALLKWWFYIRYEIM